MDKYMYTIIKNIIQNETFNLSDMLMNINKNRIRNLITEEQESELIDLARQHADSRDSVDIIKKLEEFEARIKALEKNITPDIDVDDYEEYVVGKWYYAGDKILFLGEKYICCAPEGTVCTWSPSEYPAYWKKQ